MAPKGSSQGKGIAGAKMPTLVKNWCLSLDQDRMKGFISQHLSGLIRIYSVCGAKDERAWDLFYDIIFLDPVMTCHFSQFQLMWPHRRSRSSSIWEWWAAFCSDMGQIFGKSRDQMNNWTWDNPRTWGDQVNHSKLQTTSSGQIKRTSERVFRYFSDDYTAENEPPSCQQYKPGNFLAVRPLNWDEIIDQDDDDENWANPGGPSSGRRHSSDGNDNDNSEGERDTQGCEKGTGKGKGTTDWKGKGKATEDGKGKRKWKGKGKGNDKGKGIVKQTPAGDNISHAVALQLQKWMSEAYLDTEG